MQQVGAQAFANATVVDPQLLPVLVRHPGRQVAIRAGHIWVLHRRAVLRGLVAMGCCVALAAAFAGRDQIATGLANGAGLLRGEFAQAGFSINAIGITGQAATSEAEIMAALGIGPHTSTLDFDPEIARARIEELPAIASATVRKIYPGRVVVSVTEKVPVARWRVDGITFIVDQAGEQIADAQGGYAELPLVVGDGASDDALAMIRAMGRFPTLTPGLVAYSRIGDRRWDLIYTSGLRVQLPEQGVAQALATLVRLQGEYDLLARDITHIDLRVPGMVALRPGELAAAEFKAAAGKKPKRAAGPASEYDTPAAGQSGGE